MRPGREAGREGALLFSDWLPPLALCEVLRLLAAPELRPEWRLQRRDRVSTASFRRLVLGADLIPLALWKREYTFFVLFRVCTWIMVHWVSGAGRDCWDWPPALRACERRKSLLLRGCFRVFSEERYQRVCPWITACWGELCVFTAGQFFGCWMLFCRPDVSKMRAGGERAHFISSQTCCDLNDLMLCDSFPKWSVNINLAIWFCCVPFAPFPQY